MRLALLLGAALLAGFAAAAYFTEAPRPPVVAMRPPPPAPRPPAPGADPSGSDGAGRALFEGNCAACHGKEGGGTAAGPALVHEIYAPGHHADEAFFLAVQRGVKAHHWRFGDMPPLPGLARGEVTLIVRYVRGLQRRAGIF